MNILGRVRRLSPVVLVLLALLTPAGAVPTQAAGCQFVMGFAALHDRIPLVVGNCAENEWQGTEAAGTVPTFQRTTKGFLMYANGVTEFVGSGLVWRVDASGSYILTNGERLPWDQPTVGPTTVAFDFAWETGDWLASTDAQQFLLDPTATCIDGTLSFAAHRQGACSDHGGVASF